MKKVRAIVSGKVQGVGYRMSTLAKARQLGVYGTVRNLNNGNVEIVAVGKEGVVDALIDWARYGPSSAIVDDLQTEVMDYKDTEFDSFEICR